MSVIGVSVASGILCTLKFKVKHTTDQDQIIKIIIIKQWVWPFFGDSYVNRKLEELN